MAETPEARPLKSIVANQTEKNIAKKRDFDLSEVIFLLEILRAVLIFDLFQL
jgi:hypothetical protein